MIKPYPGKVENVRNLHYLLKYIIIIKHEGKNQTVRVIRVKILYSDSRTQIINRVKKVQSFI